MFCLVRSVSNQHIIEAIQEAKKAKGLTPPNPPVGAIITNETGAEIG